MENPRDSYKSKIKEYVCSLEIGADKKKQIYVALNGGIYASLKDKKGKGTKTIYFEDGTKQRVDTYEGRFKAVSKILGEDLDNSRELYRSIINGDYGNKYRNNALKEKAAKNYSAVKKLVRSKTKKNGTLEEITLENSEQKPSEEKKDSCLQENYSEKKIIAPVSGDLKNKPVTPIGKVNYIRNSEGTWDESNPVPRGEYPDERPLQNNQIPGAGKKNSLFKKIALVTGALCAGSLMFFGGKYLQRGYSEERTAQEIYQSVTSSSNLQGNALESKVAAKAPKLEKPTKVEAPAMSRTPQVSPTNGNLPDYFLRPNVVQSENKDFVTEETLKANSSIEMLLREVKKKGQKHEEVMPSNEVEIKKTDSKKYNVLDDLKKYLDHANQRNAQLVENDISVNPFHLVKQTGNNFVPLVEEVTDCSSLGYSKEDFSNRTKGVKSGLKKIGNGLQKLVSLGFWDSRKDEEKTKEGNQVLRFLKSPYDVVLGTLQATTNSVDYVAGGVLGKTLNTTVDATRGVIGTAVSATNYIGAVPLYPLDKAEELLHKNTCSQKVYETVFSLARFGGNVLSHEVPEKGKFIEVISNDGKKVTLEKGEIGATLELITALGLDSFAISKLFDSSNGSGNSTYNGGGENTANGGAIIIPGNGGSVGGGF